MIEQKINGILNTLGPVGAVVMSVLLMIVGALIIFRPALLAWMIGIATFLAGVAVLTQIFTGEARSRM